MFISSEHSLSGGGGGGYEGPPDPVPHRPPRPSRRTITCVGIVTLLIAAIALANGVGDDPGAGRDHSPAAADDKPLAHNQGNHSRAGARDAARRYAERLGGREMVNPASRHRLLREIADPARRSAIIERYDTAYTAELNERLGLDARGQAPRGQEVVMETIPARATVTAYQADRATVAVWSSGIYGIKGDHERPVETTYFTLTITLTWTPEGWRFVESEQTEGPQPSQTTEGRR